MQATNKYGLTEKWRIRGPAIIVLELKGAIEKRSKITEGHFDYVKPKKLKRNFLFFFFLLS